MESSIPSQVNIQATFSDIKILHRTTCALATKASENLLQRAAEILSVQPLARLAAVMLPGALDWAGSRNPSVAHTAGFSHPCPWKVLVFL